MAETEEDLDLDVDNKEDSAPAAPKKKSNLKMILLIAGISILVIGMAVTITVLLMSGGSDSSGDEEETAQQSVEPKKKKASEDQSQVFYVDLENPFTVNFEDDTTIRFLQVEVQLLTHDEAVAEIVKKHLPVIRNNLVLLFSGQEYAVIISREGKEELRRQALAEVQKVVKQYYDGPGVKEVYFTSFVIQ